MRPGIPDSILAEIARVAQRVDDRGWGEATAGNLSVLLSSRQLGGEFVPATDGARLPGSLPPGRFLLISVSGSRMRDLARDPAAGLALLAPASTTTSPEGPRPPGPLGAAPQLWRRPGDGPPSSELPTHLAALAKREPGSALLHVHPDFLIALTHLPGFVLPGALEEALLPLIPETALFLKRGLARLPYADPGSAALARASGAALDRADLLVWDRHGALARGSSLAEALDRLELAEKAARIWWIGQQTGAWPRGLPAAVVTKLRQSL